METRGRKAQESNALDSDDSPAANQQFARTVFFIAIHDTGASIELEYPHMTILALYIETT